MFTINVKYINLILKNYNKKAFQLLFMVQKPCLSLKCSLIWLPEYFFGINQF